MAPDDQEGMRSVITELAGAKFVGAPRRYARDALREQLSCRVRALQFEAAVRAGIERRLRRGSRRRREEGARRNPIA